MSTHTAPVTCAHPRPAARGLVACVAIAFAAFGDIHPALAQSLYPPSNPSAPGGIYSAPRPAIDSLTVLLRRDSLDYGANWRMSQALMTLGALAGEAGRHPTRDSLFQAAGRYARRAVRIEPDRAEGHYLLAQLLGRSFADMSLRERAAVAEELLTLAEKAVELDPRHDGAWHVLGRWHMDVWRLSKLERFVASRFLGATAIEKASAAEGLKALERAVELRPSWIYHRLDLAKAYLDLQRNDDAQAQLDALAELRPNDPEDLGYLREAARLSERLASMN